MKKLALIFVLLLPAVLFAQKDSIITFRIVRPVAVIDGKTKGTIDRSVLLNAGKINIQGSDSCKITGFNMALHYISGSNCDQYAPLPVHSKGADFTDEMLSMLKILVPGDGCIKKTSVSFFDIKCTMPDGVEHTLNNITLVINEK